MVFAFTRNLVATSYGTVGYRIRPRRTSDGILNFLDVIAGMQRPRGQTPK